jgi:hypothetical protein
LNFKVEVVVVVTFVVVFTFEAVVAFKEVFTVVVVFCPLLGLPSFNNIYKVT